MRTIACGDCYRWAYQYLRAHPDAVLVHGTVAEPMGSGKRIDHAWVVHDGVVKDWQTMEAHFGGKFRGKGYPEAVYYDLWSARPEKEYTNETLWDAVARGAKEAGSMHYGPWHKNPAYPAMLAHDWNKKGQPDPTGYWASEKYDGVRALWDGENFYSRTGKIFHAPQWYKDTLPRTPLDGELWLERSVAGFQKGVGIVKRLKGGEAWRDITYIVFDIPTSTEPFEKVQAKLKRMDLGPYSHVAPQYLVRDEADMLRRYGEALAEGAEGIMLREPGSRYVPKRSRSLLKVKPKDSAEAVITGYTPGEGRHVGRIGAMQAHFLSDPSKRFKIGTGLSDALREDPPPVGSIVEITFNDYTAAGLPRFPSFLRVRTDMMADRPKRKSAPKPARKKTMAKKKDREGLFDPKHYWARRVKRKRRYSRGGSGQYPERVGDWELDETHYDGDAYGNAVYETESASFDHPLGGTASIYHRSDPEGETWQVSAISGDKERAGRVSDRPYDSLKDALAALTLTGGRKRRVAPKKRTAREARPSESRRGAANHFSMSTPQLVALGGAGARAELKRRGRDPDTGKKVRR